MSEHADRSEGAERELEELTDELESEAERLEKHGEEVGAHLDEAREDWERKRADGAVPGANPPTPEGTDFPEGGNPAQGQGGPVGGD